MLRKPFLGLGWNQSVILLLHFQKNIFLYKS